MAVQRRLADPAELRHPTRPGGHTGFPGGGLCRAAAERTPEIFNLPARQLEQRRLSVCTCRIASGGRAGPANSAGPDLDSSAVFVQRPGIRPDHRAWPHAAPSAGGARQSHWNRYRCFRHRLSDLRRTARHENRIPANRRQRKRLCQGPAGMIGCCLTDPDTG